MRARGLSLVEVLIGAVIIGVSALPVLELIRSGTRSLAITGTEAAARQLGADLVRRLSGPRIGQDRGVSPALAALLAAPARWSQVLDADPSLAYGFPVKELAPLLDEADVRVALEIKSPFAHPALGSAAAVDAFIVTVYWNDANQRSRQVKLARLVDL